jgi:hypothetical protein
MQHRQDGWRLTPAYDLTPDEPPRLEHVLHFGTGGHRPDAAALTDLARAFGLSRQTAGRIRPGSAPPSAAGAIALPTTASGRRHQPACDRHRRAAAALRVSAR